MIDLLTFFDLLDVSNFDVFGAFGAYGAYPVVTRLPTDCTSTSLPVFCFVGSKSHLFVELKSPRLGLFDPLIALDGTLFWMLVYTCVFCLLASVHMFIP